VAGTALAVQLKGLELQQINESLNGTFSGNDRALLMSSNS
jgi:hypothetical protein